MHRFQSKNIWETECETTGDIPYVLSVCSKDMTGTTQTLAGREQKDNKLLQGLLATTPPFDRVY